MKLDNFTHRLVKRKITNLIVTILTILIALAISWRL